MKDQTTPRRPPLRVFTPCTEQAGTQEGAGGAVTGLASGPQRGGDEAGLGLPLRHRIAREKGSARLRNALAP